MQCLRNNGFLLGVTLLAGVAASPAAAQQNAPAAPAQNAPSPQANIVPMADAYKLNLLIRTSLIALNQANQTGNYTVLQDLGSPAFRASNNSARLAQIFAELRAKNRDLSPVLFYKPQLLAVPQVNEQGILRLVGYFETEPERVNFDLYFQLIGQDWRIFGIGVSTTPAGDVTSALSAPPEAPATAAQQNRPAANQEAASAPAAQNPKAALAPSSEPEIAPPPSRKPVAAQPVGEGKQADADDGVDSIVKNQTTNNVARARIDLQNPAASDDGAEEAPDAPAPQAEAPQNESFWSGLNPFSSK